MSNGKVTITCDDLAKLAEIAINNGTERFFPMIAIQWANEATKQIALTNSLLKRSLPALDALDCTKTAVVYNPELQLEAAQLAREIRSFLKEPN